MVIGAAERLIRDAGSLETLTLKAVSDEAQVPRVSLYYFFPSVEALINALYQRGIERLQTALSDAPGGDDWQTVMELLMDGTRDFFAKYPVEMILSLSPKSLVSVNRANQQIGRDIYELLVAQAGLAKSRRLARPVKWRPNWRTRSGANRLLSTARSPRITTITPKSRSLPIWVR